MPESSKKVRLSALTAYDWFGTASIARSLTVPFYTGFATQFQASHNRNNVSSQSNTMSTYTLKSTSATESLDLPSFLRVSAVPRAGMVW